MFHFDKYMSVFVISPIYLKHHLLRMSEYVVFVVHFEDDSVQCRKFDRSTEESQKILKTLPDGICVEKDMSVVWTAIAVNLKKMQKLCCHLVYTLSEL